MTEDGTTAPGPLTERVMRTVRRLREAQGLAYTELAQRLAALGRPIPVLGLRRIERGERRVDVDDLAALAKVLGVPPVLLLFPIADENTTEVLPGRHVSTWRALRWFTGEAPFTGEERRDGARAWIEVDDNDLASWNGGGILVDLYRQHDRHVTEWLAAHGRAGVARQQAEAASSRERTALLKAADADDRTRFVIDLAIRQVRSQIRRYGAELPALPPSMAHLQDELVIANVDDTYFGLSFPAEKGAKE